MNDRETLDAVLLRTSQLERELAELRARNETLEAERAGGDPVRANENARRRGEAIEREQALAAAPRSALRIEATRGGILGVSMGLGFFGVMLAQSAFAEHATGVGVFATVFFGGLIALITLIPRDEPRSGGDEQLPRRFRAR